MPARLQSRITPVGEIDIEFGHYISVRDSAGLIYYKYYLDAVADSNQVYFMIDEGGQAGPRLEVRMKHYKNTEWIARYPNAHIQKHSLSRLEGCPEEYYVREFYPNDEQTPATRTDMDASGSVYITRYCDDGSVLSEESYHMPDRVHSFTQYFYRGEKLVRKKVSTGTYKIPCEILLEGKR